MWTGRRRPRLVDAEVICQRSVAARSPVLSLAPQSVTRDAAVRYVEPRCLRCWTLSYASQSLELCPNLCLLTVKPSSTSSHSLGDDRSLSTMAGTLDITSWYSLFSALLNC